VNRRPYRSARRGRAVGGTWLGALSVAAVLGVVRIGAAQSLPPRLNLPPVPSFRLSLPAPSAHPPAVQREGQSLPAYWQAPLVPREWRDFTDDELRLELETGRLELGRLAITGELSSVPGRERDCAAGCRGAGWSSSLRLKYDAGDLGPLRQTGPELNLGWTARPGLKSPTLLRGGFSGQF
jgi:hypothetical protein